MKRVTIFCLFLIGMITTSVSANYLNDREAKEKERIKNIEFIEIEYELEKNMDLLRYLPNDFDPYKGMIIDISKIEFIEISEPINIDFDTLDYLPNNFNPYKGM